MNRQTDDGAMIFEVGPRDGLQSLSLEVPTQEKIRLVDALAQSGFTKIETTSFVSPKWVPQLKDAAQVMQGILRKPDVRYTVLTPNLRGFEHALKAGADEIAIFASASEAFSRANLNCSIDESLERFEPVLEQARVAGLPVRGYLSAVIACPFEGAVAPGQVREVAERLLHMGCYEVSLGDTIGAGNRETMAALLDVLLDTMSADLLAGHFHDTHGTALEMIRHCVERGMRTFDSSVGGLGGCPYAPGSSGNVATGAVVTLLEAMGLRTGIDLAALKAAETIAASILRDAA
ncbi:MAG: hydroxymethylglutaryl-CoA lyase [Rhizobiaceae bacterium]|nr:hydroxymethylglutaryl-CoA lyase [Rhizobiaceae bacterium]